MVIKGVEYAYKSRNLDSVVKYFIRWYNCLIAEEKFLDSIYMQHMFKTKLSFSPSFFFLLYKYM